MKKDCISLILLIFLPLYNSLSAGLIEFYKKGTIKFSASPDFGKDTDWETLFYDVDKELVIAPDGNIFVSNSSQHNIFKFTGNGKFVGKFGRKGQGPGDFYRPKNLSILDDKYLVIGEYAANRRISLFDFTGKFIKVLKANHSVFSTIALKDNKIAYLTYKYGSEKKLEKKFTTMIIIKDAGTGIENVIDSVDILDKGSIRIGDTSSIKFGNHIGKVLIARTKDDCLLVGASNTPDLKIYSLNRKLIHSFRLNMSPVPVTGSYIRKFKNDILNDMKGKSGGGRIRAAPKWLVNKVERVSFATLFGEHLPYYRKILVDSEGNILVFKWSGCIGDCVEIFQVYSPEGKYICETQIDKGVFDFKIDGSNKNIVFTSKGIYGLLQLKNSDDVSLRLVKVDWKYR